MPNEVKFLLGKPPEEAIAFLHQKKLLAKKVFKKSLWDSALAKSVTISHLNSLEMTQDIYVSMEDALRNGKSFNQWKKELVNELERKGWVYGHDKKISRGVDGKLIADKSTGEHFGTPRRLNTIYRTNMQSAYAAARYQRYMDNIDNRPYWQYSAVGDQRTRPAHQALNGRVYRYDDPFWATFFPPNGFNCRCTVIALDERALKRKGIESVPSSESQLLKVKRPKDKAGNQETTIGFALPDGRFLMTDKGFDYNVGRLTYRPNLDLYHEKLAHQFAKVEMSGGEFRLAFNKLEEAVAQAKGGNEKLSTDEIVKVRNALTQNFKFAAGRLSEEAQKQINSKVGTVWLSDDTLIKQLNSRGGQDFGVLDYANLPDILNNPLKIELDEREGWRFYAELDGKHYFVVVKVLAQYNEMFVQSFRLVSDKQWDKAFN